MAVRIPGKRLSKKKEKPRVGGVKVGLVITLDEQIAGDPSSNNFYPRTQY